MEPSLQSWAGRHCVVSFSFLGLGRPQLVVCRDRVVLGTRSRPGARLHRPFLHVSATGSWDCPTAPYCAQSCSEPATLSQSVRAASEQPCGPGAPGTASITGTSTASKEAPFIPTDLPAPAGSELPAAWVSGSDNGALFRCYLAICVFSLEHSYSSVCTDDTSG